MEQNNAVNLIYLPAEILNKILVMIKNVKIMKINKFFNDFVKSLINDYDEMFSNIQIKWQFNIAPLIKKLFIRNNIDGLLFLINNYSHLYQLKELIIKYAMKYKNSYILKNALTGQIDKAFVLISALKYKNRELTDKYIDIVNKDSNHLDEIIALLARNGYIDLLKKVLEKTNQYNLMGLVAIYAALGNQIDIVKYAMTFQLENSVYYAIALNAIKSGNIDILNLVWDNVKSNTEILIFEAAKHKRNEILISLIKNSTNQINYNTIADAASEGGNEFALELAIKNGADNFTQMLSSAVTYCNVNIILFLRDKIKIPLDYNILTMYAAENGCIDLLKDLLKNINSLNYLSIANLLINSYKTFDYFKSFIKDHHLESEDMLNNFAKRALIFNNYDIFVYLVETYNLNILELINNYPANKISVNIQLYIINKTGLVFDSILNYALDNDVLIIIKYIINAGYNNYKFIIDKAISNDSENIVAYILSLKDTNIDLNEELDDAILNEANNKILELLVINGASNLYKLVHYGITKNDLNIVKIATEHGFNDFKFIAFETLENFKSQNIVLYALEHINNLEEINFIALNATIYGYTEIAIQSINKGATNLNEIVIEAIKNYNMQIIEKAIENGANNYEEIAKTMYDYYYY